MRSLSSLYRFSGAYLLGKRFDQLRSLSYMIFSLNCSVILFSRARALTGYVHIFKDKNQPITKSSLQNQSVFFVIPFKLSTLRLEARLFFVTFKFTKSECVKFKFILIYSASIRQKTCNARIHCNNFFLFSFFFEKYNFFVVN